MRKLYLEKQPTEEWVMAQRNGFSELAKLLVRYPTRGQREKLKQLLLQNYTQENLIEYLTHEIAPTRQAAAYALGIIGDMEAVSSLVKALQHSDPDMRSNAEQAFVVNLVSLRRSIRRWYASKRCRIYQERTVCRSY